MIRINSVFGCPAYFTSHFPNQLHLVCFDRFAYTVATVLLSTLVRQLKLHQLKGQVMEVRSELVSTPKDETWITVSRKG